MWRGALRWALGLCWVVTAQAADLTVAVAANFAAPMHKLAAAFERDSGHRLVLAFGSTGKFYAQIRHGAPCDVLLAADQDTPARLAREGFGHADSQFTYATGRLVLWSRQPGLVDAQGAVLKAGGFDRLALADPKLAPYGAAALQTLERLGLLAQLRPKLVQGDSIAQAYQFVASGNARLGFVALSQLMLDGQIGAGSAWIVPAELHAPLHQDALLLRRGQGQPAAAALLAYLRSAPARAIMRGHGYSF